MNKHVSYLLNEFFIKIFGTPVYHPRFWLDERDKLPYTQNLSRLHRWKTLLKGFNSDKLFVYRFDKNDRKLFVNDIRRRILCERISKKYYYLVHDKVVFHKYFFGVVELTPRVGLLNNGGMILIAPPSSSGMSRANGGDASVSVRSLVRDVINDECYFLKPLDGGSGKGILKVESRFGKLLVNGIVSDEDRLCKQLASLNGYLVERRLPQSGFSNRIYPDALNTLRIMTMIDPQSGNPFIPVALHRFGTTKSGHADNWSRGGLSVWIDIASGTLGKGVQYPFDGKLKFLSEHPDTKIEFEGYQIQNWKEVVSEVLKAASFVPFLPYVGWDVVLTGDQVLFQEANYNPDLNLIQVHRPLLSDTAVRRFYEHHGVV